MNREFGTVEESKAGILSLENGMPLIIALANNRRAMKLTVLAEIAGMSPAKAHRYLVSFIRVGFAAQDPVTGLYEVGPAALSFSISCLTTLDPISKAIRASERLCVETGYAAAICAWGTFGPTVVRWEQPSYPVLVNAGLGTVYPIYRSATGRVFAAFMPEKLIQEHTKKTGQIEDPAIESVQQVRERGLARSTGELIPSTFAFAAPIFDDRGRLALTLTLLGYTGSADIDWDGPLATAVSFAAAEVSGSLGYKQV